MIVNLSSDPKGIVGVSFILKGVGSFVLDQEEELDIEETKLANMSFKSAREQMRLER